MQSRKVQDIMFDCETLGVSDNPILLSIGAYNLQTKDSLYLKCDIESQYKLGFDKPMESTQKWWMQQSPEARKEAFEGERENITECLTQLAYFVQNAGKDKKVWSNGAIADIKWLGNAYRRIGVQCPWEYWQEGCYRTMRDEWVEFIQEPKFDGVKHNALADAIHQARVLELIFTFKKGLKQ